MKACGCLAPSIVPKVASDWDLNSNGQMDGMPMFFGNQLSGAHFFDGFAASGIHNLL